MQKTVFNSKRLPLIVGLMLFFCGGISAMASAQTRIVVLPFYVEEGADAADGGEATDHYRRMMRFINNQLVENDFEVINPFAHDGAEKEYNRLLERAREDSSLACLEVCKKYGVDVAYIVWLNVNWERTKNGYKARARLDGEGYDSAGRDLGVGVSKTFKVSKTDCDDAIADVEKEVGDVVGRKLTAWSSKRNATVVSGGSSVSSSSRQGGVIQRRADALENLIDVRLDQCNEHQLLEVFGKIVNTATGVVEAKRYNTRVIPDNPQGCYATWRVEIDGTEPFRLQTNIMKMISDILDAGGEIVLNGVPYRYTSSEIDLLKGVRPGDATSRSVQFILDRELARDREFENRYDSYDEMSTEADGVSQYSGTTLESGGALQQNADELEDLIEVRLDRCAEYELAEAFGKILNITKGVTEAKLYDQRIVRDNPGASYMIWRVEIDTNITEPFRLQTNIMKLVSDLLDAGGNITIEGVPFRYSTSEVELFKGLYPGDATSRSLQFVMDGGTAGDLESQELHAPYGRGQGFE